MLRVVVLTLADDAPQLIVRVQDPIGPLGRPAKVLVYPQSGSIMLGPYDALVAGYGYNVNDRFPIELMSGDELWVKRGNTMQITTAQFLVSGDIDVVEP